MYNIYGLDGAPCGVKLWGVKEAAEPGVNDGAEVDQDTLKAFVQTRLARYKAPKSILFKPSLGRAPNGKADYKSIKAFAMESLGVSA